jgi:acyl-CoA thioester hydrolase
VIYFEVGRVDFTRQVGAPYAELEDLGYSLAVSDLHVRYIAPARFDQMITVRTRLAEARSRTVVFDYEIIDTETRQMLVTGDVKLVCVDHDGQVRRIPQRWLDVMQPLVVEA